VFAGTSFGAPAVFGDAFGVLSAVVWIGLTVAYLLQGPRRILADARDATVGPFLAAPVMTAYVLAADVLEPHAPGTARTIVIAFLVIGLLAHRPMVVRRARGRDVRACVLPPHDRDRLRWGRRGCDGRLAQHYRAFLRHRHRGVGSD
jgi:hypothetical protein